MHLTFQWALHVRAILPFPFADMNFSQSVVSSNQVQTNRHVPIVFKFQSSSYNIFWDIIGHGIRIFIQWILVKWRTDTDRQTDRHRQTESDAYEPTVQYAQVG